MLLQVPVTLLACSLVIEMSSHKKANRMNISSPHLQYINTNIPLCTTDLIKFSILLLRSFLEDSVLFLEINHINSSFCKA